jgi:hypothetical protein
MFIWGFVYLVIGGLPIKTARCECIGLWASLGRRQKEDGFNGGCRKRKWLQREEQLEPTTMHQV